MTEIERPNASDELTRLAREFMGGLREALNEADPAEQDYLVERVFAVVAACGAAALIVLPGGRRRSALIAALLGSSLRHLNLSRRHGKGVL